MQNLKDKIQSLVSSFKFDKEVPRKERASITIWVSREEKMKYDIFQARTSRQFSKLVQNAVREAIKSAEGL